MQQSFTSAGLKLSTDVEPAAESSVCEATEKAEAQAMACSAASGVWRGGDGHEELGGGA